MIEALFARAPVQPQSRLWVWRLLYPPIRAFILLWMVLPVEGRERVPARGPYILVVNHINWKDPPLISLALQVSIRWMAKVEVFEWFVVGFLLRGIGCFPVRRGESDRRAIVTALRVLEAGQPLGFFPEGHRSERGQLQRAKTGIALLALRSGALVVPCGIAGTPTARLRLRRRREVAIRIGEPFYVTQLAEARERDEQAIADAIMRRIAALLPPEMRGEYA